MADLLTAVIELNEKATVLQVKMFQSQLELHNWEVTYDAQTTSYVIKGIKDRGEVLRVYTTFYPCAKSCDIYEPN